ncbi:MAG: HEAT repeat domain-containing protein [Planctomycetia bacterium]|nr:HEAT repeat domain-containing protein [Planctomycetia bacterium]
MPAAIRIRRAASLATLLALVAGVPRAGEPRIPAAPAVAESREPSQQELMAERGFVRYRGGWRTVQEIELIERGEKTHLAQREWTVKLERLRRQVDQASQSDRAAEEIRGISDPAAVAAVATALLKEPVFRVRAWYVEALSRIRSPDAVGALVATALDHGDPETRIAAVDRLGVIGPHLAVPTLVAALRSSDNAQINRAAEALGRLGVPSAVAPLIDALQTQHIMVTGDGTPEGSTSATFTPGGGGLSMGSSSKRIKTAVRNERVLEALVALTGANFEWDAQAWRAWLANRQAPPPGFDPRRG